jgi:uncharacterized protein YcfJ
MNKSSLLLAAALSLGVCGPAAAGSDKVLGAVIGGTAGGAVGYQVGGDGGAAIGALIGAVVGAEIADKNDKRRRSYDHYDRGYHRYHGKPQGYYRAPPPRHAYVHYDQRRGRDHWRDDRRHRHDRYCRH